MPGKIYSFQAQRANNRVVTRRPYSCPRVAREIACSTHAQRGQAHDRRALCSLLQREQLLSLQRQQRFITGFQSLLVSSRWHDPHSGYHSTGNRSWYQVKIKKKMPGWEIILPLAHYYSNKRFMVHFFLDSGGDN